MCPRDDSSSYVTIGLDHDDATMTTTATGATWCHQPPLDECITSKTLLYNDRKHHLSRPCPTTNRIRLEEMMTGVGAMFIMATGALSFSLEFAAAKEIQNNHGPGTTVCFRGAVGFVLAVITALLSSNRKGPLYGYRRQNIKFLILKAFLGGTSTILAFLAVKVSRIIDINVLKLAQLQQEREAERSKKKSDICIPVYRYRGHRWIGRVFGGLATTTHSLTFCHVTNRLPLPPFLSLLQNVSLACAGVIAGTSTLWAAAMSYFFEKGSWRCIDTFAALCCIWGIILATKPAPLFHGREKKDGDLALGLTCATVHAITQAASTMTIRAVREEHTSIIALYSMAGSAIIAFPWMVFEQMMCEGNRSLGADSTIVHWSLLFSTGVTGWLAVMLKTLALQLSQGLGVLIMWYLNSLFSVAWDFALFHAHFDEIRLAGVLVVLFGCIVSACGATTTTTTTTSWFSSTKWWSWWENGIIILSSSPQQKKVVGDGNKVEAKEGDEEAPSPSS